MMIEINGTMYEDDCINDEMYLMIEGVLIAKTIGDYCLVNADGSARIEDVKKWMEFCTEAKYIAHTTRI